MDELASDLTTHVSKSLADIGGEFDAMATMGCGATARGSRRRKREDRALPDPRHIDDDAYHAVREELSARVKTLLATL